MTDVPITLNESTRLLIDVLAAERLLLVLTGPGIDLELPGKAS